MSNSSLVTYSRITDKKNPRTQPIVGIIPHCYVGQVTAKQGCDYFCTNGKSNSANYVVGCDGIGLNVPENYRAWTSGGVDSNGNPIRVNGISGRDADFRCVTIEIACDKNKPYKMTDKVIDNLVALMADICKRNGIPKLLWKADKSLVGKWEEQNVLVHRWFANTSCPGDWLYSRLGEICNRVNALLITDKSLLLYKKGDEVYTTKDYTVYSSESNALKAINPKKVYPAGKYYIYKISNGCVNISKSKLLPGGWILP